MQPPNLAMLRAACEEADVELGAYDLRILAWLAGWEPQVCVVVASVHSRGTSALARMALLTDLPSLSWRRPSVKESNDTAKPCRHFRRPSWQVCYSFNIFRCR